LNTYLWENLFLKNNYILMMFRPAEKALLALMAHHCNTDSLKTEKEASQPGFLSEVLSNMMPKYI